MECYCVKVRSTYCVKAVRNESFPESGHLLPTVTVFITKGDQFFFLHKKLLKRIG